MNSLNPQLNPLLSQPDRSGTIADPASPSTLPDLSVVIPIFNEVKTLPTLLNQVEAILKSHKFVYEIICVDDGSTDGSGEELRQQARQRSHLRAILLRRNYGQAAAMAAGFNHAVGQIIVTLDGALQNDPADIPRLVNKLAEGYDLVNGWRKQRQDATLTRSLPSRLGNWLIGQVTGLKIHDYGCSLKAYRSELVADLNLYGELHRFLPFLALIEGAIIAEIPVNHHARQYGKSQYGPGRTFRVLMDLLTLFFMKRFLTRPMHVFGMLGLISMGLGIAIGIYLCFLKLGLGQDIGDRPLLILAVVLFLTGVQLFGFGLLAEISMRTYYESQNRPIYRIREIVGSGFSKE
jgi:glycosyltransferase involved in cell wall biosynthesis